MTPLLRNAAAAAVTLLLLGPGSVAAQTSGTASPPAGIQVHGHWTIEVREGDRIVERREFENALSSSWPLAAVLSGRHVPHRWRIDIRLDRCPDLVSGAYVNGECQSRDSFWANTSSPVAGENAYKLVMHAANDIEYVDQTTETANLEQVSTVLYSCQDTVSPDDCYYGDSGLVDPEGLYSFTHKDLAEPLTLEDGQTLAIMIVISFQ